MSAEITAVFTTWPNHPKRWEYFNLCVSRVLRMMRASQHNLIYKCVSESERDPLNNWYGQHLQEYCERNNIPLTYRKHVANLGGMMNAAMAASETKYTIIIQDDWYLHEECDLSPGISFMEENPEIDIIRYSWPGDTMVTYAGEYKGWKKLDPLGMWPYGDDPHIRRDTFISRFGKYIEYGHHGASEGDMVYRFGAKNAFVLVAPKCYFGHCGAVSAVIREERKRAVKR